MWLGASSISDLTRDGIGCSKHPRENSAWNEPKSTALPYGWIFHLNKTSKESSMYRLLSCTAVVVCMALTPALAADDFEPSRRTRSINGCQRAKLGAASVGSSKRR